MDNGLDIPVPVWAPVTNQREVLTTQNRIDHWGVGLGLRGNFAGVVKRRGDAGR